MPEVTEEEMAAVDPESKEGLICALEKAKEEAKEAQDKLQRFLDLGMGNFICLNTGAMGCEGATAMARLLVEANVHFIVNGTDSSFTPARMKGLEDLAGEYYMGTYVISEIASLAYWDRDYFQTLTPAVDWKAALGEGSYLALISHVIAAGKRQSTCRKRQQSPWLYLAAVIHNRRSGLAVPKLPIAKGSE